MLKFEMIERNAYMMDDVLLFDPAITWIALFCNKTRTRRRTPNNSAESTVDSMSEV